MPRLLLIDHDPAALSEALHQGFPAPMYQILVAADGATAVERTRDDRPDVVLLEWQLAEESGLDVYERIREIDRRVPVLFTTATRSADAAIEAMKRGAFDYLKKPPDLAYLQRVVAEALDASRVAAPSVRAEPTNEPSDEGALLGADPAMLEIYKAIGRVAGQDVTVLILGESGTGKELVARAIHEHSTRAKAPFGALNCAAIPEDLLETELFGHEKGAFTGADRRRIGKFEQLSGGTLLLDEIGDMPLAQQAKILRVVQEQSFERIGGNETIRTDVRVIAATHRDLGGGADEGTFRRDLYYRLGVFTIRVPALRERGDDIGLLAHHFVRRFGRELGRDVREIAPEAVDRLRAYPWPGNVRELQSVIQQALLRASGPVLLPAFLPELCAPVAVVTAPPVTSPSSFDLDAFIREHMTPSCPDVYAATHLQVDRLLVSAALKRTRGNQRRAARLLGISRQTLRSRLGVLGLEAKRG